MVGLRDPFTSHFNLLSLDKRVDRAIVVNTLHENPQNPNDDYDLYEIGVLAPTALQFALATIAVPKQMELSKVCAALSSPDGSAPLPIRVVNYETFRVKEGEMAILMILSILQNLALPIIAVSSEQLDNSLTTFWRPRVKKTGFESAACDLFRKDKTNLPPEVLLHTRGVWTLGYRTIVVNDEHLAEFLEGRIADLMEGEFTGEVDPPSLRDPRNDEELDRDALDLPDEPEEIDTDELEEPEADEIEYDLDPEDFEEYVD